VWLASSDFISRGETGEGVMSLSIFDWRLSIQNRLGIFRFQPAENGRNFI